MATRFHKSIKLTKGVKLNLNKNSVSITAGTKGAHFTVNSKGDTTTSVGIPGSGLSYVKKSSHSSDTASEPTQLDKNIFIDNEDMIISGTKVTLAELNFKITECNNTAFIYFICAFTAFPLIGLLSNIILSYFIQIPYFVMAIVPCIAGLTISAFQLIAASDYKHMLKLYQIYMDKQTEKAEQNNSSPVNETTVPLSEEIHTAPKETLLTYTDVKVDTIKDTELYNSTTVEYNEIKKYPPETLEKIKDKFIAIDVETTGLDEYSDYIVELSTVIFKNMKISQKFSTLLYSPVSISEEASEVNNLTDDMLKGAPQQNVAMLQFAEFIRDALNGDIVLVAHNSYFDYKFIREAFKRCGINATLLMDDTLKLSETYLNARTNRLSDVARHLGIKYPQNHRAEKDAVTCGKIYAHFINRYISDKKYNPFI